MGKNATLYAFGGVNYRRGEATGFYRLPYQSRNVIEVYPNGFLPEINSNIVDKSIAIGVRNRVGNWDVDFSNTYGSNAFDYLITNTLNASLKPLHPLLSIPEDLVLLKIRPTLISAVIGMM